VIVLETKLEFVKGVGKENIKIFRNHQIWSSYDLVLRYPKSYEDYSITSFENLKDKKEIVVKGKIINSPKIYNFSKSNLIQFKVKIFEKIIDIVVFRRAYLAKTLKINDEIIIKGIYHLYTNKIVANHILKTDQKSSIKPIYNIEGIHDKNITSILENIFENKQVLIFETLPEEIIDKYKLPTREKAYQLLHFPKSFDDINLAKKRFKYEEAFFLQLKLTFEQPKFIYRKPKQYDLTKVKELISKLPYELTGDQKNAVNDIFRDFKKEHASMRLIQGDVGSGKTVVALIATYGVITNGEQVSILAPTELLANQHFQYFNSYLNDVKIALLTRKTKNKDEMKLKIKNHEYDLVIGTHALIQEDVEFSNLGLVIVDEQHKFGVKTRDELIEKSNTKDVIYLTATPIPRTLAMVLYGDNHVSIIKEKPSDRQVIETKYIKKELIQELYDMMHSALIRGEHIYLVVPAIDSDKVDDNIETVYQSIKEEFVNRNIFILHGKLKDDEKEDIMEKFIYTPSSILISTTMIEVGIDIPTATIIGIYSAEYFGLSQLHQLRGRVGRSNLASFCYLISNKDDVERLETLSKTDDGFKLSEFDLIDRGPGDFLGDRQSGYLDFNFLDLLSDYQILIDAKNDCDLLLSKSDFKTNPKYKYLNMHLNKTLKI
jgi:ATP-dependent DNA helicase RecG